MFKTCRKKKSYFKLLLGGWWTLSHKIIGDSAASVSPLLYHRELRMKFIKWNLGFIYFYEWTARSIEHSLLLALPFFTTVSVSQTYCLLSCFSQQEIILMLEFADFKCLLVREQKKKEEQECSLGFYFLYAQPRQFHQLLVLLKGRLDDATNMMTWKKLHGLLFWGLKQRGTHAPLAWIWFTDFSFPNLNA